jgi:hypothetical protein
MDPVSRSHRGWPATVASVFFSVLAISPAAWACTPGEGGCLPTPSECATGGYNGFWDGGAPGKFAACIGASGHVIAYVGGAAVPTCGVVISADQVIQGGGDPNDCAPAYRPPAPEGSIESAARAIGLDACEDVLSRDTPPVAFTQCTGELRTFDGIGLDTRLSFPRGATGPLPTVLLLHAWGSNRFEWQDQPGRPDARTSWGRVRFIAQGYATMAYTARGFNASCGVEDPIADVNASGGPGIVPENPAACARGWTHIAERDYEVRDSQTLLGQLIDAGIANGSKLAATGESYGAGQTWQLATAMPWTTPAGRGPIQLAAAVPMHGWTDLLDAVVPNGRATDAIDQSRSHETPLGVPKPSWFDSLWLVGRQNPFILAPVLGSAAADPAGFALNAIFLTANFGRYNDQDPTELHSFIDGWAALFSAGEPFDAVAADALAQAFRGKSAYYADGYLQAVASGALPAVPVFSAQGWTDTLFPPVQALQMYRRLRAAKSTYPIWMAFADIGHAPAQSPPYSTARIDELAGSFLSHYLSGATLAPALANRVLSFRVQCGAQEPEAPVSAANWDKLPTSTQAFASTQPQTTLSVQRAPLRSATGDPPDPLLGVPGVTAGTAACLVQEPGQGTARWIWPVPSGGLTLVGLPRLAADYVLTGGNATVIAKLWDVAPGGARRLVTRGVYRLSALLGGDSPAGTLSFRLFGNHWFFAPQHHVELEISQADAPFLRPDNYASSIAWRGVRLSLPKR